ncbi:hypothetical protein [Cedecea sp.]|jgi:hypothetical protein|uniref:hypothetical protein n=1 Tax=Cedecea sp. TaxID=1970739 RepID=UPI002F40FB9C
MSDLFWETIQAKRIDLMARLITTAQSKEQEDQSIALDWIADIAGELRQKLETYVHPSRSHDDPVSERRGSGPPQ